MPAKPKVAVSYSWNEEKATTNHRAVARFCKELEKAGIAYVRDTDSVRLGDSLSQFMRQVGTANYLCVFLSDGYLKSRNCMYELLVAWQYNRDNPEEFAKRVKVWVMPGAEKIRKIRGRIECASYWKKQWKADEPVFKQHRAIISGESHDEHSLMAEFVTNADAILKFFADRLSPSSAEGYAAWIKAELLPPAQGRARIPAPKSTSPRPSVGGSSVPGTHLAVKKSSAAKPKPGAKALAEIYANTIKEIEAALNRSTALREFLAVATSGLIHQPSGQWALTPAVKGREFDVCSHLAAIADALESFNGQSHDWLALGEIVGGLVVLAVDRNWVVAQRELASAASAKMPADDQVIGLGGPRSANLLHLATAALADGCARLEKVFGKPPLDESRVPDPPVVPRGIGGPDQEREIKLHLIRHVDRFAKVNTADPKDIEIKFKRTKGILTAAFRDDHRPYYGTGEHFEKLESMIRDNLKVHDLLLIHPSGEDPEKLVTDYVRVLRFLGTIFDEVAARTSK